MIAATQPRIIKTNYQTNYAKFSNQDCQIRFKNDKLPSAKEVFFYLLSLPHNWDIKVERVALHFQTSRKFMKTLFDIIISNDRMIAIPIRKKTGKFDGIIYKIIQGPVVASRPMVKLVDKPPEIKNKKPKSPVVVSRPLATYSRQKKYTNTTTPQIPPNPPPPPEPKPLVVGSIFEELKQRCRDDIRNDFNQATHKKLLAMGYTNGQIKTLIDQTNQGPAKTFGWLMTMLPEYTIAKTIDADIQAEIKRKADIAARIVLEARAREQLKKEGSILDDINARVERRNKKIADLDQGGKNEVLKFIIGLSDAVGALKIKRLVAANGLDYIFGRRLYQPKIDKYFENYPG